MNFYENNMMLMPQN